MLKWLLFAFVLFLTPAQASVELKTNFLPSFAMVGRNDFVLSTHNTILFGMGSFHLGAYGSFETISENVTDQAYGGALRIGESTYLELQGGYFQRDFKQHSTTLRGKGMAANVIVGTHLSQHFGLSLFLSGKRIESGMDRRWIVDLLPFLTLRAEL